MKSEFLENLIENVKEKFGSAWQSTMDWLNEQQWFQELKEKWDEIDPQSKTYLQFAAVGAGALGTLLLLISSMISVSSLKTEFLEKRALLSLLQSASDEIAQLQDAAQQPGGGTQGDTAVSWPSYFEAIATNAGLSKSNFAVTGEKAGQSGTSVKESLFELELKHINIKQLVNYSFSLEGGQRLVKLRNLVINTKDDLSGYLDATLAVSGFAIEGKM